MAQFKIFFGNVAAVFLPPTNPGNSGNGKPGKPPGQAKKEVAYFGHLQFLKKSRARRREHVFSITSFLPGASTTYLPPAANQMQINRISSSPKVVILS